MGKKKEQYCPLTRWQYFTKTLYHDPSATGEFTYDGVVYRKSEALQTVESRNSRLQMGLVGLMFLAFVLATYFRSAMPLAAGILLIVAGPTGIRTPSGGWRISPISGSSGSSPKPSGRTGPLRCGRPVWGAIAAWGSLPPALPSVPTIWACPRCGWSGWSRVRRWGRCSMSAAQI